ncbi:hypothetical protein EON63_15425 [archaeon]|nr:MAG: hypothetical protein EON63_15425 [archaeon]
MCAPIPINIHIHIYTHTHTGVSGGDGRHHAAGLQCVRYHRHPRQGRRSTRLVTCMSSDMVCMVHEWIWVIWLYQ